MRYTFRSALVAVFMFVFTVSASAPQLINYQGTLTNSGGTPVNDDTYSVTFTIYNADSGGESKWSEVQNVKTVNGQFAVLLGTVNPIHDSVFNEPDRFLGITVDSDPETDPRARLVTMPYGFRTATIDGASGGTIGGSLTILVDNHDSVGNAITVIDTSGAVVLTVTVKDGDVASVSFYDPVDSKIGPDAITPIKLRLGKNGITFFGVDSSDTVFNVSSVGDIAAAGQLAVGDAASNNGIGAISLGFLNVASGNNSSIGGGLADTANATLSRIGGGASNFIASPAISAVICGGRHNFSSGEYSFIGGGGGASESDSNATFADWSVVVGGKSNRTTGLYSAIGGGLENYIGGDYATVPGGRENSAIGKYSAIGGGLSNLASGDSSTTVSGGKLNTASGRAATVGGGESNTASGKYTSVSGGWFNTASFDRATVGGGGFNHATSSYTTIAGGLSNRANSALATIGGGQWNLSSGTGSTVAGGVYDTANGEYSVVSGGSFNVANGDESFIGGGQYNTTLASTDSGSVICGGFQNRSSGKYAFIGGGGGRLATDSNSTSGAWSCILGGKRNYATGDYGVVVGGLNNSAGTRSFAAGDKAKATHARSFVWSDGLQQTSSFAVGTFVTKATGGYRMYSDTLGSGAELTAGSSAWKSLSDSTVKRNIREVDYDAVLEKLAELPISQWSYKSQDESIEHIGPMAQDFYRLFGLGEDDLRISTLDPDGVSLAAIKALYLDNQELKALLKKQQESLFKEHQELEKIKALLLKLLNEK